MTQTRNTNIYEVAGHRFAVTANESLLQEMEQQYGPFRVKDTNICRLIFWLKVVESDEFPSTEGMVEEKRFDDDFETMVIGHIGLQTYVEFFHRDQCRGRLLVDVNREKAIVMAPGDALYALNNAAMLMYTLTTSQLGTALFHSSVVEKDGKGYMFLGVSGTGKSTHSSLWLKYIPGTQLVNDDNPVVRVNDDGTATVYGSPWSGKTPCYRNVSYPIGGIVKLEQALVNRIRPLRGIEAYAEVVPSISGKRWDKDMADGLHQTQNALVTNVPMWHLACLPDEEAAKVCYEAVTGK